MVEQQERRILPTPGRKGETSPTALLKEATAKLSQGDFDRLVEFSKNAGRPRGAIVREAILQYLHQSAKTQPQLN